MVVDGYRPDRFDIIGALVCLVGMAVIMYAPAGTDPLPVVGVRLAQGRSPPRRSGRWKEWRIRNIRTASHGKPGPARLLSVTFRSDVPQAPFLTYSGRPPCGLCPAAVSVLRCGRSCAVEGGVFEGPGVFDRLQVGEHRRIGQPPAYRLFDLFDDVVAPLHGPGPGHEDM
jgi:hypothetical protein